MSAIRRVAVGISGGVDSAVAALLLKKKGFDVHGVFMKNWDEIDETGSCSLHDINDARYVCDKLKIPFHEVNFVKQYWSEVFMYFTNEYETGCTPNPDIVCNKKIKFDLFFDHVTRELKADAMATGHYARNSFGNYLEKFNPSVNAKLLKSADSNKDQTFFLCQIPQASLRKTMFPLGDYIKDNVKKMAYEHGLEKIAKKHESMGICFIGSRKYKEFIAEYITPKPGKFIDIDTGKTLGNHLGIHLYTVGQRTLIPGCVHSAYVLRKDVETGIILVALGIDHPSLFTEVLYTSQPHWIHSDPPEGQRLLECDFRFQHRKPVIKCQALDLKSGGLTVLLERPLRALTPGQYAVFYKGDECLGGARINMPGPSFSSLGKTIPKGYDEYGSLKCQESVCL